MKKKLLILAGVVVILIIGVIAIALSLHSSSSDSSSNKASTSDTSASKSKSDTSSSDSLPELKPIIGDPCNMLTAARINTVFGSNVSAGVESGDSDEPACNWDNSTDDANATVSLDVLYSGRADDSYQSFMDNPAFRGQYHKTARVIGDDSAWLTSNDPSVDSVEATLMVRKNNYEYQFDLSYDSGITSALQAKLLDLTEPIFK